MLDYKKKSQGTIDGAFAKFYNDDDEMELVFEVMEKKPFKYEEDFGKLSV